MGQITPHISYEEATHSDTANRYDIDNTPDEDQLKNMWFIGTEIFEPLRCYVGGPIQITSMFRSKDLNNKIGGVKSSQHLCNNGAAMDIDDTYGHKTNKEMFNFIIDNLVFDQVIWEFGDDENPAWVHVSYARTNNRCIILKRTVDGYENYLK